MNVFTVFDYMGVDPEYVVFGLCIFCVVILVALVILLVKVSKLKKEFRRFMSGKDAESLEELIVERFREIDYLLKADLEKKDLLKEIKENISIVFQKKGIVKYDAFAEMGGKLSFSLAMLDKENNGFIINSMHTREGCYTYIKEIIKGESFIALSDEEKKALQAAIHAESII